MRFEKLYHLIIGFCLLGSPMMAQKSDVQLFTINAQMHHQTIDNFGASDCWSTRFVGNWPEAKTKAMADYLFSMELDKNGKPKGIGLSAWRFNIGGGSADQGEQSGIKDVWRMGETFVNPDGTYDWNKLKGQRWFLRAAKERGVKQFIGFVNSPPYTMTRTGKTYGDSLENCNLDNGRFPDFAKYLCEVTRAVKEKEGVEFQYISPVNEPQWRWMQANNQEGSMYRNTEFASLVRVLDKTIQEYKLNSKILTTESASHDFLYGETDQYKYNGRQVDAFWGQSENNVSALKTMAPIVASHDYFTTWPLSKLIESREKVGAKVGEHKGLKFWATEYCLLGTEGIIPHKKDLGMETALYVARIIHYDLTLANASAWQWWLAISPGDYKDGLIYTDRNEKDGNFQVSKLMWGLGNFSRFIRPGALRIQVDPPTGKTELERADDLLVSAYLNESRKEVTIVAINNSKESKKLKFDFKGIRIKKLVSYTTSDVAGNDLRPQKAVATGEQTVPARAILTYIGSYSQ